MNSTRISICGGVVLATVGFISCAPSSQVGSGPNEHHDSHEALGPVPPATQASWTAEGTGRHWVQNQQLRSLMKALNAKTQTNWPRNVPQDPEDAPAGNIDEVMDNAAKLADSLADAAVQIPASTTNSKMSEADSAGFQAEASILHRQALRLGEAARAKNVEHMQISLDALGDTCISCHSRYRDFSGELRSK